MIWGAWPTRCWSSIATPRRAAELGQKGAEGVRSAYTVAHMARTALELYERVARGELRPARPLSAARALAGIVRPPC